VTIVADHPTASEPGTNRGDLGRFTITRDGCTDVAVQVDFSIGGTATFGRDYNRLRAFASIPVGQTVTRVTVHPKDDPTPEPTETVDFTLLPGTDYTVGTPGSATVNILDDDGSN
jgi:hypothetical protein